MRDGRLQTDPASVVCCGVAWGGPIKTLLGKISLLELEGSPWLLLWPLAVRMLTNHSWLRALLSWGSYSNLR